jgi:hypothetical protein
MDEPQVNLSYEQWQARVLVLKSRIRAVQQMVEDEIQKGEAKTIKTAKTFGEGSSRSQLQNM